MHMKDQVIVVVRFEVSNVAKFKEVATLCKAYVDDAEPGTLVYDWHLSKDETEGRLVEVYKDKEAFRAHLVGKIFTELAPQFGESIKFHSFDTFGPMPDEISLLDGIPSTHWLMPAA